MELPDKSSILGLALTLVFIATSIYTFSTTPKVVTIGFVAFAAMMMGGLLALRDIKSHKMIVWLYGMSGGAAFASVMLFILPQALNLSKNFGAAGIIAGFLAGLVLHSASHRLTHSVTKGHSSLWSVSLHSITAGLIIGLIYNQMPSAALTLGLAIVSHKLPAGYMVADRLKRDRESFWMKLLLPASGIGAMASLVNIFSVSLGTTSRALFFGFSAGIFLHLALDFIPNPEPESHLRKILTGDEDPHHHELDEITIHCLASTIIGAAVIILAALTV
ncbi:ZIP family metal transporter [Candidatus Nanohaloarchaea archaeon]|nr:ZIP family metal transporter [Candidatus Nanohaloarchaea archaeon]